MDGSLWLIIYDRRRRQNKLHIPPRLSDKSDLEKRLAIKDQVENIINNERWLYAN
ncbi:MAG TPA: hypothetical protein VF233_02660 [Nitrososphaeraceae archaeon]|jgi:hypothetical protein